MAKPARPLIQGPNVSSQTTRKPLERRDFFRGRRLADDAVDAVLQRNRVIVHRRQAASYQTTRNLLNGNVFLWEAA
ncbi:hypothetical protein V2I81_22525, partial [Pseudomonas viridiflava]|nr:hypothetical protein [Pseudomonas viridiflava]